MPCQTQTSQQPQQPTTVLPQTLPQTQADWSRFLQRMNEVLASIGNAQYATGINAVPTEYAVYDGTGLPPLRVTGATTAFDTAHAQFGAGSLKLTATASTVTVELAASGYPITLHPNWQWIASLFLLTSAPSIAGKLSVVTPAKQYDVDISGSPGVSWSRLYGDYDLTADANTSCTLLLTLTGVTIGQVFNLEGWMLEPSQGAVLPSPFIMTSGPRTWNQVVGSDAVNTNISTAQSTAATANTIATAANANTPPVINPQFANGTNGWSVPNIGWYEEAAGSAHQPDPIVPTYCVHAGSTVISGSLSTDVLPNTAHLPAVVGQQVSLACCVRELSVNAGALAYARISWRDINNNEISTSSPSGSAQYPTCGAAGTGTYTQCVTKITAIAPSGAQYAVAELAVSGHTSGYFTFCNAVMGLIPSSVDEVPDGSAYARTLAAALVDGTIPLAGAGKALLGNPTFLRNTMGIGNTTIAQGGYARDNWLVNLVQTPQWTVLTETGDVLFRVVTGSSLGNSAQVQAKMQSEHFPVTPGQLLVGEMIAGIAYGSSPPAGVTTLIRLYINWVDATGAYIGGAALGDIGRSSATMRASVTVPATSGGSAVAGAYAELQTFLVNTSGSTYTAGSLPYDCRVTSCNVYSVSSIDDEVTDGTIYGRTSQNDLYVSGGVNRIGLRIPGSGHRLGDQRNLLQRTITNYPSKVSPGVSYSASAGTPATATISVAAFTALLGSVSVSYNAASASVTGTNGTNVNYYLYFNDPTYGGGTQTLVATTNQNDLYSGDGYVYVGYVTVAFPSSGSGSGGGTGCPLRTAWVIRRGRHGRPQYVRAGKVRVGDWLLRTDGKWAEVTFSRAELQPCVRLVADGFGTLGCSISAPMQLREGSALSIDCLDREVVARAAGVCGHVTVTALRNLGDQWVQHITLGNAPDDFFWTGDAKDALFGHHNAKPP